ncbi:RNA methyltransferase [Aeromonas hydrophila]|nr:RNA methyltransferase [Aeromonas hydrophila]
MLYVAIPKGCMNLAVSVNVILYDRLAKRLRAK